MAVQHRSATQPPDRDRLRPRPAGDVRKRPYPTILRLVCNQEVRGLNPLGSTPLGGEDQAGVSPAESGCQPLWTVSVPIGLPMMLSAAKWLLDCNGCYRAPGVVHERLTCQALMHHVRPVHQSLW